MKRSILSAILVLLAVAAQAQIKQTENTIRRAPEAAIPGATVDDMAWLAGQWIGDGLGGSTEETWSAPAGGAMIGYFRLLREDKPVFYEFMTIRETERGLAMQIKHFNPDMKAWEEKEKFVEFLYAGASGNRVFFEGLTFERRSDTELTVYLAFKTKDGSPREERFSMRRVR